MKSFIEATILLFLAGETAELAWRSLAWAQSPPELPTAAWAALIAVNLAVCFLGARRLLR
jgi:hypothetical protein